MQNPQREYARCEIFDRNFGFFENALVFEKIEISARFFEVARAAAILLRVHTVRAQCALLLHTT